MQFAGLAVATVAVVVWFLFLYVVLNQESLVGRPVDFNEKWPPIDDDEFMRRCPPGIQRQTALKVRRIVAEQLGITYDQIYPEQTFVGDLDAD